MFNNLIGKNKELGRFLFCERYTLPPVKNAMYIAEGQELKRGAVVDVNGVLVGTNSLMPYAVLEFDCDTRSGGKEASVLIKGEFNFDKLYFADGLGKSDLDNIVYNGSGLGIVIKPYEYAEGFSPLMVPAGTSQSNPLMNAEETERMINAMKPIDDMTLRFEFSKKDYNPETADVGSTGTWTKVDSPTLNIWDWENTNTDWSSAFRGAFTDTENEVRVIAAGDTSSVTKFRYIFAGTYTSSPAQTNYSLTARNNVVECCPFSLDGLGTGSNDGAEMFAASYLKKPVVFDYSNVGDIGISLMFADTMITEIGDMYFSAKNAVGLFSRCSKLKKAGVITFDSSKLSTTGSLGTFSPVQIAQETCLEEVGGIEGTENLTDFQALFSQCRALKRILKPLNMTSATACVGVFNGCNSLESIPPLTGLGSSPVTTSQSMFNGCRKIKSVPLFDTSHITNASSMLNACYELESIPDYDFSSVTTCNRFARMCYKMKSGITETYNKFLNRGASITNKDDCFTDCGRDTPQGRAALAQIPQSWGGLAEG